MCGIPPRSIGLLLAVFVHAALTERLVMGGVGQKVILPCGSPSVEPCSYVRWSKSTQYRTQYRTHEVASITRTSPAAATKGRLHIDSSCALHVDSLTEADVGFYWCSKENERIYLSVITVSSEPEFNLMPGDTVTLKCQLLTYDGYCSSSLYGGMSLRWQDDIQQSQSTIQTDKCTVTLTLTIQQPWSYSCLAVVGGRVLNTVAFPVRFSAVTESLVMGGVGQKVILPCGSPSVEPCSDVRWSKSTRYGTDVVAHISRTTPAAATKGRLHIESSCALHVDNLTEADVGSYRCNNEYEGIYLSVITVSSKPGLNLMPGGTVTLKCQLLTYDGYCSSSLYGGMSLRWQDDIQQSQSTIQTDKCTVTLTLTIQQPWSYSCLAVVGGRVLNTVAFPVRFSAVTESLVMGGVGQKVILPCGSPSVEPCSDVRWSKSTRYGTDVVAHISRATPAAATKGRLHIESSCALHVDNLTEADVGSYRCNNEYEPTYLSVITVSSKPGLNLMPGGTVTLKCQLLTYEGYGSCSSSLYDGMSLRWQDDIQQSQSNSTPSPQTDKCTVTLTVTIQPPWSYSCLAVVGGQVQNTVAFPVRFSGNSSQVVIHVAVLGCLAMMAVLGCLAMMAVLALIVVKKKKDNE
ncbi:hypothetical protein NHX12_000110 [Muraenolepis orangiensis]|uniref:Ig-like domain-containing protein n=1 Tax=Muraenolepis orangiensis TaxID=630683 RepID=A0A9Q0D6N8_9TELE|nr:hypothetical protein NHX12_000110 [Muraenolepis orangiensis]